MPPPRTLGCRQSALPIGTHDHLATLPSHPSSATPPLDSVAARRSTCATTQSVVTALSVTSPQPTESYPSPSQSRSDLQQSRAICKKLRPTDSEPVLRHQCNCRHARLHMSPPPPLLRLPPPTHARGALVTATPTAALAAQSASSNSPQAPSRRRPRSRSC